MSLAGGFITHYVVLRGWLGENILRRDQSTQTRTISQVIRAGLRSMRQRLADSWSPRFGIIHEAPMVTEAIACCSADFQPQAAIVTAGSSSLPVPVLQAKPSECGTTCGAEFEPEKPFWQRLVGETWTATTMVIKFMLLAWFIGAIVKLYVPEEWITQVLSGDNPWSIMTAALLGVPVYTSNLAAMPLVGGLLALGMHPAAALAFLIAGPITTLPAMSAVWGLVNRKVFTLYIGFALVGAVVLGYIYNLALQF